MLSLLALTACWSEPPPSASSAPPSDPALPPGDPAAPDRPPVAAPPADLSDAPGLFRPLPEHALSEAQRAEIEALETLGYTSGDTKAPATSATGVVRHDPARTAPGLTLWTSGHAPEAYLSQPDGTVVHTWRLTFDEAFGTLAADTKRRGTRYWRHVQLLPDRGLLAIFEGHGLVCLDRDSRLQWSLLERVHHDLQLLPDGRMLVLARQGKVAPALDPDRPVVDDLVLLLSADGTVEHTISVLDALEGTEWLPWVLAAENARGDLLHTNSLFRLTAPLPGIDGLGPGDVLLSLRNIHALVGLDWQTERIVWAARGPWRGQHDLQALPSGELLLFDNFGADQGHASAIRQLRPPDLAATWTYTGTATDPFSSPFFGAVQRLPGGNTLISDSWVGRAIEVTPTGEIVWELRNPHRVRRDGQTYVAVLPTARRISPPAP
ncbi:MAG: arylsulfotransferase family protein [Myxococcales bacterium]|nr:arylsulfotransferase family protein [Myxococcales bacterium]